MTTIRATCPTCGDVDLRPQDVTITVARVLGWSAYTFICVSCHDPVEKPADDDVVELLVGAGVRVEQVDVPMEYLEARALERSAAPITADELLDFGLWLGVVDDVVAAISEVR